MLTNDDDDLSSLAVAVLDESAHSNFCGSILEFELIFTSTGLKLEKEPNIVPSLTRREKEVYNVIKEAVPKFELRGILYEKVEDSSKPNGDGVYHRYLRYVSKID